MGSTFPLSYFDATAYRAVELGMFYGKIGVKYAVIGMNICKDQIVIYWPIVKTNVYLLAQKTAEVVWPLFVHFTAFLEANSAHLLISLVSATTCGLVMGMCFISIMRNHSPGEPSPR